MLYFGVNRNGEQEFIQRYYNYWYW